MRSVWAALPVAVCNHQQDLQPYLPRWIVPHRGTVLADIRLVPLRTIPLGSQVPFPLPTHCLGVLLWTHHASHSQSTSRGCTMAANLQSAFRGPLGANATRDAYVALSLELQLFGQRSPCHLVSSFSSPCCWICRILFAEWIVIVG